MGGACGALATAAIVTLPLYRFVESSSTASGTVYGETGSLTLLQVQGHLEPVTRFFLAAMACLSLAALVVSLFGQTKPRIAGLVVLVAGLVLLFGSFISGFSVGGYYLPGALLVFLAGLLILAG